MYKHLRLLLAIICAVLIAFAMRGIFSINGLYSVMTVTFLLGLPFAVGYVTVYLCKLETIRYSSNAFFIPFIPIFVFFILTLVWNIEGFACWAMILPIFLVIAGLGGLLSRHYRLKREERENKTFVFLAVLLPFFIGPIEKAIGAIPGQYQAYTEIIIHASKEQIWKNVTRVSTIKSRQDSAVFTRLLGFPRPIKAELDKEAIGGKRKAIFDKGLIFDEEVTAYEPFKLMRFSIHANPYNIPSTTMDKHLVVGGEFFDVLSGTYQLEQMNVNTYKLKLFSNFKLHTTFNFYASIWAGWIMKDIQQNILKVIKERSEVKSTAYKN